MVNKSLKILLLFLLLAVTGCSYMDMTEGREIDVELGSLSLTPKTDSTLYYYYQGERIPLTERKDLIAFQFVDKESEDKFLSDLSSSSILKRWNNDEGNNSLNILILQSVKGSISKEDFEEWRGLEDVHFLSYPFEKDGHVFVMLDEFSVKVKKTSDEQEVRKLAARYDCEVFQREVFDSDIFFVRCSKWSEMGTIRIANAFYETGLFEFASPDFYTPNMLLSNDPYFSYQWGLKNTGQYGTSGIDINVESAWTHTEGSEDIVVAVIDSGVELNHPDLLSNLVCGYDAVEDSLGGGPIYYSDYHGTAAAGIIAASKDNNVGISGVAPSCKIMPIMMGGETNEQVAASIQWAKEHGADVINCSWTAIIPCDLLTSEINSAATQGRNGKGCIIVAAAGNYDTNVFYPASLGNVIGVGAYSYDGNRKNPYSPDGNSSWGSNYGSGLNLVAPGVNIKTTYTNNSYNDFEQTSSAAPHVSGVAALILSEYPYFTREQVTKAILYSCTTPSGYSYTYSIDYPYTVMYNSEVGHGRLNAGNALALAYQMDYQNYLDSISGIDVTIQNNSSSSLGGIVIGLLGDIGGNTTMLQYGYLGEVASWQQIGYPVFRGQDLSNYTPGSTISNIQLNIYAYENNPDPNGLRIAVQMDNPLPSNYEEFSFGYGDNYERSLPNSSVPDGYRRRLYIRIINND